MPFSKLKLPCGLGGINRTPNTEDIPFYDVHTATNISNDYRTWQKLPGAFKFSETAIATAGTSTTYVHPFSRTNPYYVLVCTGEDLDVGIYATIKAYSHGLEKTIAAVSATYPTGMNISGDNFMFVRGYTTSVDGSGRREPHVFIYTGMTYPIAWDFYSDVAKVIDGTNGTNIPVDWDDASASRAKPFGAVLHNNRLFSWGNTNDPHRLYFTTVNDHADYTGEGSGNLTVYSGEGEGIMGCVSFLGRLFIFKYPQGIYWLDDSLSHIADWNIQRFNNAIGLAGPKALTLTDDDVVFMGSSGMFHHLRGIVEYGDIRTSQIYPDQIEPFMNENVELSNLREVEAAYIGRDKTIHFSVPVKDSLTGTPNRIISLDFSEPKKPVFLWNPRDLANSVTRYWDTDGREYLMYTGMKSGEANSYIWVVGRHLAHSYDGDAYTGTFRTPYLFPQGGSDNRINVYNLEAVFEKAKASKCVFNVYQDDTLTQSVTMTVPQTGTALGTFTLDTSTLGGDHNVTNVRKLIYGDTRRLQIEGTNEDNDSNFIISKLWIGLEKGNERLVE